MFFKDRNRQPAIGIFLLTFMRLSASLAGSNEVDELSLVTNRFTALKPAVVLQYDANYRFLFFDLSHVGDLSITLAEGLWNAKGTNAAVPACLLEFQVLPPAGKDTKDAAVRINKRTVCVLSMPDLEIIRYAKLNDEYFKPLFRKGRRVKYTEVCDFESGHLDYRFTDLVAGSVLTNIPGQDELERQCKEIAAVLKHLHSAYVDPESTVKTQTAMTVHFQVDGAVRTFSINTRKTTESIALLGTKTNVVESTIGPGGGTGDLNESFSLNCLPFRTFAGITTNSVLMDVAAQGHDWYMIPSSGQYELYVGAIHCIMREISVRGTNGLSLAHLP